MSKSEPNYETAMGLGGRWGESHELDPRWHALNRAHEIRQFEIELYWKRGTYFFALQVAVFAAVGFTIGNSPAPGGGPFLELLLTCLGFLAAYAGWLAAKGSKFWVENWERHIDELEDDFEGHLHKAVWSKAEGQNWSVTEVNDRLLLGFVLTWSGLAAHGLYSVGYTFGIGEFDLCNPSWSRTGAWFAVTAMVGATLYLARQMWLQKTRLLSQKPTYRQTVNGTVRELRVREKGGPLTP